jgi:signal peptidase II
VSLPAGVRSGAWCAGISVLCLAADIATKAWALSALRGHPITAAGGLVRLQLVINHGAAFGIAAHFEPLLTVVSLAGVILLGLWAVRASAMAEKLGAAVAAAGGVGNLLDRLARPPAVLHGGVVDWLHLSFYGPTFNLADIWLRGGLLVAGGVWLWHQRAGHAPRPRP